MSARKQWHLLCYDIADVRRVQRINRFMKNEGIPLQYSVFLVRCNRLEAIELMARLQARIDEKVDDVRLYPICNRVDFVAMGRQQFSDGLVFQDEGVIRLEE